MSDIFRDPTEGVTARRADLLRRRRDELVMMPHAIRRVFVARRARTAASLAIVLVGSGLLALAAKPAWAQFFAKGLPGINPAVLCTLVIAMWLVGLFAYFVARAVDEHRFAVAMSKLVMPSKNVNEDVERLSHENPDQAARDMAHRLEVRSAALPVLAAGVLLPVTAMYGFAIFRAGGWPAIASFEGAVARHATALLGCAGVGAVLALAMTKRATRLPIVAPMMMGVAVAAGAGAFVSLWLVAIALIAASVSLVVRKLGKERDALQAEDPAAGSEIWTIRGAIKKARETGAAVIARIKRVRARTLVVTGCIWAVAVAGVMLTMPKKEKPAVQAAALVTAPTTAPVTAVEPTGARSTVEVLGNGALRVTLDLVDDKPLSLPALAGLRDIPPTWNASIRIEQQEGLGLAVKWLDDANDAAVTTIGSPTTITQPNCTIGEKALGLRFTGAPGHYVLVLEPKLTPADCGSL